MRSLLSNGLFLFFTRIYGIVRMSRISALIYEKQKYKSDTYRNNKLSSRVPVEVVAFSDDLFLFIPACPPYPSR